jgi:hypothetical protein
VISQEKATAELAKRGVPATPQEAEQQQRESQYTIEHAMNIMKIAAANPEKAKEVLDRRKKQEGIHWDGTISDFANHVAALGRGEDNLFGNDFFDTVGAGIATGLALPGAVQDYWRKNPEVNQSGLVNTLRKATELAPEIYQDIKGSVDYEADKFAEENPAAAQNLGRAGDIASWVAPGTAGALLAARPAAGLAKSVAQLPGKAAGAVAEFGGRFVGPLARRAVQGYTKAGGPGGRVY